MRSWALAVSIAVVAVVLPGVGCSSLVGTVYPVLGYAGIVIIVLMLATVLRARKDPDDPLLHDS